MIAPFPFLLCQAQHMQGLKINRICKTENVITTIKILSMQQYKAEMSN